MSEPLKPQPQNLVKDSGDGARQRLEGLVRRLRLGRIVTLLLLEELQLVLGFRALLIQAEDLAPGQRRSTGDLNWV